MRNQFQDALKQPQSEQEFIQRDEEIDRQARRSERRIAASSTDPDALAHVKPALRHIAPVDESDWRTHLERSHNFIAQAAHVVERDARAALIAKAQVSLAVARTLLP